MATLTGNPIKDSYDGLIKTTDNAALDGTSKQLTDGVGNVVPMEVSTTGINFQGDIDFAQATVTGLPQGVEAVYAGTGISVDQSTGQVTITNTVVDTNTTYDLASITSGADVNVTLTGSDATTDTIKLVAGTNITLTDNGSNNITIEAAGGGAAGLELGTGALSLQNGIGGVSNASGVNSVAIGNATAASQEASIALGDRATATGYGSFAAGLFAQAAGFGGFALGQYAESSQSYGSAFGPSSKSIAESAIAFGQATEANHAGAIAMGRQVVTVNADTTHVRALYIVAPDNGIGGNGITMLSPDGTAWVITVDNTGALVIT
jgi:hypothetical protein